jgi:hypothetical protein
MFIKPGSNESMISFDKDRPGEVFAESIDSSPPDSDPRNQEQET